MSPDVFNKLEITQTHRLQLNAQLLQSMSVLCMNTAELGNYIDKVYQENPCIEKSEPVISEEMLRVLKDYRSRDYGAPGARGDERIHTSGTVNTGSGAHSNDEGGELKGELSASYVDDYIESLGYNLKNQLTRLDISKPVRSVCEYLIDLLEDDGRLTRDSIESVGSIGVPEDILHQAVDVIKGLEPAGVGAEDAAELVRLQLERYYPDEQLAHRIAQPEYLEDIAKHNYKALAVKLNASAESVRAAAELIAGLSSKKISSGYNKKEETVYIYPDVYIYVDENGTVHADANEYDVPRVSVSDKYLELYKSTDDKELKSYLRDKINEAYKLIGNIGRRKSTLGRCFDFVAEAQKDYFTGASHTLKPMTMTDAAEELGVNVSTVSRCLMHKYVQCPQGVMPAGYFFPRPVPSGRFGTDEQSRQGAEYHIAKLIEGEDKAHPLSDSTLCELLNRDGYTVKRRTVAKYRAVLGIPDYRVRRNKYGYR